MVTLRLADLLGKENAFCPSIREVVVHHHKVEDGVKAAYSRFTFARWDIEQFKTWHDIQGMRNVYEILGGGREAKWPPWPVLGGVVEDWISRADNQSVVEGLADQIEKSILPCEPGDWVRFTHGSFENILAHCDWTDKNGVHLKIRGLLGRDQGVYIPLAIGATIVLDDPSASIWVPNRRRSHRGGISSRLYKHLKTLRIGTRMG
jgi:hypothetical protein